MKIITYGMKESRYALICMLINRKTNECVDNTIRYYNSDKLENLSKIASKLNENLLHDSDLLDKYTFDMCVYDYKEHHYVRNY